MNKKIYKLLFFTLVVFLCGFKVNVFALKEYKNEQTNYRVLIEDTALLLKPPEREKLMEDMKPLTEYGNIAFKTINSNSSTTEYYASNYYHEIFGTSSGTLFLIDMDNRYIYIFSDGLNYKTITRAKANIITDNVYKYASNAEYYKCASNAFEQINTILEGGKIAEPMRYISNILISFIVAFLMNFIVVLYNTKIKKATVKEIISNCHVKFNINDIKVIKTGQHSVYSPISDSSSSSGGFSSGGRSSGGGFSGGGRSSGGGFSGGGRSSGGGGGHRF